MKKKAAKKSSAPRRFAGDVQQISTRQTADVIEWLNETAADAGLSRDQFIRIIFTSAREGMEHAKKPGTDEKTLFDTFRRETIAAVTDVVREHLPPSMPAVKVKQSMGGKRS